VNNTRLLAARSVATVGVALVATCALGAAVPRSKRPSCSAASVARSAEARDGAGARAGRRPGAGAVYAAGVNRWTGRGVRASMAAASARRPAGRGARHCVFPAVTSLVSLPGWGGRHDLKVGDPVADRGGGGGGNALNGSYSHYALATANRLIPNARRILTYAESGRAGDGRRHAASESSGSRSSPARECWSQVLPAASAVRWRSWPGSGRARDRHRLRAATTHS